jgi:hypothetical protein
MIFLNFFRKMKIPKPPRPMGPPLPPPPNIILFDSNHNVKDQSVFNSQSIESEKEFSYNKFLHSHVLNFYEYAMHSESDVSKRVKCNFIDLTNVDYLFLNDNESFKLKSAISPSKTATTITIKSTQTSKHSIGNPVTKHMFQSLFELDLLPFSNRTKSKLKSISLYKNKKLKQLEIENQPIFRLINATNSYTQTSHTKILSNFTTQSVYSNFETHHNLNSTNYYHISKEDNDTSNLNDLFDQIYSNQAIFLYKMLLIPSVILILVLILACIALITKK